MHMQHGDRRTSACCSAATIIWLYNQLQTLGDPVGHQGRTDKPLCLPSSVSTATAEQISEPTYAVVLQRRFWIFSQRETCKQNTACQRHITQMKHTCGHIENYSGRENVAAPALCAAGHVGRLVAGHADKSGGLLRCAHGRGCPPSVPHGQPCSSLPASTRLVMLRLFNVSPMSQQLSMEAMSMSGS